MADFTGILGLNKGKDVAAVFLFGNLGQDHLDDAVEGLLRVELLEGRRNRLQSFRSEAMH